VFAYFYLTDKLRVDDLIRSLIKQFSVKCAIIPEALAKLYDQYQSDHQQPTTKALMGIIPLILEGFHHVYLVLDGLDECPERTKLMDWIAEFIAGKPDKLHVLVASRRERDIIDRLGSLIPISIDIEYGVVDDIGMYLRETLETDLQLTSKKWSTEVREEIRTTLMEGANGM
jgi:hypothetical protein